MAIRSAEGPYEAVRDDPAMNLRQLGRSGLLVSELALGTMSFGGRGRYADVGRSGVADARRLVDMAVDAGINLIDTADVYSWGESEEILAKAIKGAKKKGVKTVVHIGSWEHGQDAIESGATAVTHFFDDQVIPNEVLKVWAKSKTSRGSIMSVLAS